MSFHLKNGLQVVLTNIPDTETVITSMWIKQGSKNETSINNGLSHITEHMVFNRNNKKNSELSGMFEKLQDCGVTYNATTTKENTYYYFQGLKESLDICLDVIKLIIVNNRRFDEELFENELKVVESEASSFYASFKQIKERTGQALYGDYGIGKLILGSMDNIRSTTLADVESLIAQTYVPENSILVVMGNIDYDNDAWKIEKKFNSWEDSGVVNVEEKIDNEPSVYYDDNYGGLNAAVSLGFRVPYANENESVCVELLSLILSDPVISERIPFEIRQKRGLAYNAGGFVNQYKKMCTLGIACTSACTNIEEIVQIILDEIEKLCAVGVHKAELERAKMNLITKKNFELSDPLKHILCLGTHITYGRVYYFEKEMRTIKKISMEHINSMVKSIFCDQNMGLALIGKVNLENIVDGLFLERG